MANHKVINPSGTSTVYHPLPAMRVAARDDGPRVGQWQPDDHSVDLTEPNPQPRNQHGLSELTVCDLRVLPQSSRSERTTIYQG